MLPHGELHLVSMRFPDNGAAYREPVVEHLAERRRFRRWFETLFLEGPSVPFFQEPRPRRVE